METMAIYTISGELHIWDSKEEQYHSVSSLPSVAKTFKHAREIMEFKLDIVNKANCKNSLKLDRIYTSDDKVLRAYYYHDETNNYKVQYTIYKHQL